jgi:hypothetical protein
MLWIVWAALVVGGLVLAYTAFRNRGGPSARYVTEDVLVEEDFTQVFDWDEAASGGVVIGAADGAYRMQSNTSQYVRAVGGRPQGDVVIEVSALQLSSERTNAYGVMCRASPNDGESRGYYFFIGGDGTYSIRRGLGGSVDALVNWSRSSAIHRGSAANSLRVICVEDYLALYVNDEFVAEVHDNTFATGYIGFALATSEGTTIEVAFDDLTIWSAHLAPAE